jgi:hypothetical protein
LVVGVVSDMKGYYLCRRDTDMVSVSSVGRIAVPLLLLAVPAAAPALQAVTDGSKPKLICKKIAETGSHVRKTKVCLTRDQWEGSATRHQDYGRDLQDSLRSKPGGGGA